MTRPSPPSRARRPTVPRTARRSAAVAFGLQGFLLAVVLTQLPQYQERFGLSDTLIVVSVVTLSVVAGTGSVLAEALARRVGSAGTLRLGLALIAITAVGVAASPGATAVLVVLAAYGLGLGIVDAAANMQAVAIQHEYGRFILSSFHAVWSVGSIVGALFVAATNALDAPFVTIQMGAALVVAAGLAWAAPRLLPRDPSRATRRGTDSGTGAFPPEVRRALIALGVALALFYAVDFGIGNWSALFLTNVLHSDGGTAALGLAAYQCAALVARGCGDRAVARIGELAVVRAATVVGVIGLLLVATAPSPAVAITGFLVTGLGLPVVAPLCFGIVGRLAPAGRLDSVIARVNIFNYVGTLCGAAIIGSVAAGAGLRIGFAVAVGFVAALTVLASAFAAPRRSRTGPAADPTQGISFVEGTDAGPDGGERR
ncbi:MFS transporter [Rhodococcus sp. HNM0569]|uniref:MFS transporter n=1 Tax=Rhodococcus sp. HNM0569 TaxID=2716340 RepID=UPI00146E4D69|nr:MFS transporter [Rhodococcus sp. HNM0569]